jgi:hypothetical protein
MDRIINMIINQVIRRFVNIGVNKGISHFAGKGKAPTTPQDHVQTNAAREATKRARQAAKITRRLGR